MGVVELQWHMEEALKTCWSSLGTFSITEDGQGEAPDLGTLEQWRVVQLCPPYLELAPLSVWFK